MKQINESYKQDGERLCSELKVLEEEMGQGREEVMGHLKEINSIKKVIDTEVLILIITGFRLLLSTYY